MSDEEVANGRSTAWAERLRRRFKGSFGRRYLPSSAGNALRIGRSFRLLPTVLPKPRLAFLWLRSARRAHFASAVIILFLTMLAPGTFGAIADGVYPPVKTEKTVLVVFKRNRTYDHPSRDTLYTGLVTSGWVLGLGFIAMVFVNHVPAAVRLARRRARVLIARAEQLQDPLKRAQLLTAAHALLPHNSAATGDPLATAPETQSQQAAKTMLISLSKPKTTRFVGNNNRYRLDRVIGSGGMGVVHAAYDTVLKRPVALKQLFAHLVNEPEQNERFRQEATALAALSHNHIVGVYDLLEESGSFWIVMELLTGGSLGDRIREGTVMAIAASVDVICKIAEGLGYAHGLGMVHRDVKPMNILFTGNGTPKLADFGNVKIALSSVHTQHGVTLGSPIYMSPEQAAGEVADHRSDIYSLGVTLYHMLTGRVPFDGDVGAILAQHIGQAPQPPNELNDEISDDLAEAIIVMLNKRPEARFQDTGQLISALRRSIAIAEAG